MVHAGELFHARGWPQSPLHSQTQAAKAWSRAALPDFFSVMSDEMRASEYKQNNILRLDEKCGDSYSPIMKPKT